jgi:hypothetical protein
VLQGSGWISFGEQPRAGGEGSVRYEFRPALRKS